VSGLDNLWFHLLVGALGGYVTGAIPFGFLVYRWATGTDIRTVGSGNIGATNVGRLLGFRYFVLVFLLDLLKGFAPVLCVPLVLRGLGMTPPADLGLFVALAAILGHNFPVYLGFKGGKGVATSLGALLALEPLSCAAAAIGFFLAFFLTRYVSLSSIAGAFGFVAGHFLRIKDPWSRPNLTMSLLAIAIAVLILIRHHKNIVRIFRGTEPKVPLRRRGAKEEQSMKPRGGINHWFLAGLVIVSGAAVSGSTWLVRRARMPIEVNAGRWTLRETHRELTGQQRSTRVLFAENGRKLAVLCPRYNRILFYDVTDTEKLTQVAEISLEGRPVAMAEIGRHLVVLERPAGDDKHLTPGWWETFKLDGSRDGERVLAGFYPDDLAVTPDGLFLLVLSSGRAEGDKSKPPGCLDVYARPSQGLPSQSPVGHFELEPADDADRLVVSAMGGRVLITLPKAKEEIAINISPKGSPRLAGRIALPETGTPYVSVSLDGDWMVMPTLPQKEAVVIDHLEYLHDWGSPDPWVGFLLYTLPDESAVELAQSTPRRALGRFPVKGPLNLGGTSPSGLAFSAERGLVAITTKAGTVHLVSIRSCIFDSAGQSARRVAATAGSTSQGPRAQ
jgi:glycerol-3-phosphate acyltransferase PlsY